MWKPPLRRRWGPPSARRSPPSPPRTRGAGSASPATPPRTDPQSALEQGLEASEREGRPISAKYELSDGGLQLSVYTVKGDRFEEVIVDHKSGTISKAEPITEGDDLKNARAQGQAMAQAKRPLAQAVTETAKANGGFPPPRGGPPPQARRP